MWNCTHFRHPTDEQLRHVDIYFLATKIICSLSTLNEYIFSCVGFGKVQNRKNIIEVPWLVLFLYDKMSIKTVLSSVLLFLRVICDLTCDLTCGLWSDL